MKFFPYDRFEIDSRLSVDAAVAALAERVDQESGFKWFYASPSPFHGTVSRDGFKIMRSIGYRNSFLPIIVGQIRPGPRGCVVTVEMRLHRFILAFIVVWIGFIGAAAFSAIRISIARGSVGTALIPGGMLAFMWILANGAFWYEARRAKELLIQLFGSRTGDPA